MSKLSFAILVVALVYCVGAHADANTQDLPNPFNIEMPHIPMPELPNPEAIRNMKPQENGHSVGSFVSHHSSSSTKDGQLVSQEEGGQIIENIDGKAKSISF